MQLKRCVYVLPSETEHDRFYTGLTSNVAARLTEYNAGRCGSTASGRPWKIIVIKSGSGCAFARRHLR